VARKAKAPLEEAPERDFLSETLVSDGSPERNEAVYTLTFDYIPLGALTKFEIVSEQGRNDDRWSYVAFPNLPSRNQGTLWKVEGTITAPYVSINAD
jgi:hypothetical protein